MTIWPIAFQLPNGRQVTLPLCTSAPPDQVRIVGDAVEYALPEGQHAYLASKASTNFAQPPPDDVFGLRPTTRHMLTLSVQVDGAALSIHLIEYAERERLNQWWQPLRTGQCTLTWTTDARRKSNCLALRLSGTGRLCVVSGAMAEMPDVPASAAEFDESWQPRLGPVDACGDAQIWMGVCRSGDPRMPDVGGAALAAVLRQQHVGRALVMPYGSDRRRDTFDQISALALAHPGAVCPLLGLPMWPESRAADLEFLMNQLELLWQTGRLYGLAIWRGPEEAPAARVLEWIERRQVLTLWPIAEPRDLTRLAEQVLPAYSFPVLLAHAGGDPLGHGGCEQALSLLDRFGQVYLVSSVVLQPADLEAAIRRHPQRVLLGSGCPAVSPFVAQAAIRRLNLGTEMQSRVLAENLRFLTERVEWVRGRALGDPAELRFPPLPATPAEVEQQGFVIVAPPAFDAGEPEAAKDFWAGCAVSSFYQADQPWARLLADLVTDLKIASVLEFGCNVGRNLAAIAAAAPDVRLVGVDVNAEAIRLGRERSGLDLRTGDEHALRDFRDGEFDLVFTVSVLDHIADVRGVCRELLRCARRHVLCLEVTLPVEGKVLRHYDHNARTVKESTGASYSWHVAKYLQNEPRLWRLDARPCYLHNRSLGPYYWSYLAFLEPPA
jgi:SAM-dependent methyltransferase